MVHLDYSLFTYCSKKVFYHMSIIDVGFFLWGLQPLYLSNVWYKYSWQFAAKFLWEGQQIMWTWLLYPYYAALKRNITWLWSSTCYIQGISIQQSTLRESIQRVNPTLHLNRPYADAFILQRHPTVCGTSMVTINSLTRN